jgi:hypothetical protein
VPVGKARQGGPRRKPAEPVTLRGAGLDGRPGSARDRRLVT